MTDRSIHPRVEGGRAKHEKVNTRKSKSAETLEKLKAALSAHLATNPNDGVSKRHLAKL